MYASGLKIKASLDLVSGPAPNEPPTAKATIEPLANLSTAERYYNAGEMPAAAHFAVLAIKKLPQGSPDWQRAGWDFPECATGS